MSRRTYRRGARGRQPYRRAPVATRRVVQKQIIASSEKKLASYGTNTTIGVTGNFEALTSNIAQGTAEGERVGRSINPVGFYLTCSISVADTTNYFRIILFKWDAKGVAPTVADILQDTTYPTVSPLNSDSDGTFRVLFDKRLILCNGTNTAVRLFKKYVALKNIQTKYSSDGVGAAANLEGQLYVLRISDSGAVAHPAMIGFSKLWYTDS